MASRLSRHNRGEEKGLGHGVGLGSGTKGKGWPGTCVTGPGWG